mmetsp:Transcript_39294/g.91849  ORF Transcript_39294/g.91849 Transcript_39294/m.91849 type:complete len:309 (-) Transcript_39294:393-1319(-)
MHSKALSEESLVEGHAFKGPFKSLVEGHALGGGLNLRLGQGKPLLVHFLEHELAILLLEPKSLHQSQASLLARNAALKGRILDVDRPELLLSGVLGNVLNILPSCLHHHRRGVGLRRVVLEIKDDVAKLGAQLDLAILVRVLRLGCSSLLRLDTCPRKALRLVLGELRTHPGLLLGVLLLLPPSLFLADLLFLLRLFLASLRHFLHARDPVDLLELLHLLVSLGLLCSHLGEFLFQRLFLLLRGQVALGLLRGDHERLVDVSILAVVREPSHGRLQVAVARQPQALLRTHLGETHILELIHQLLVHLV